MRRLFLLLLLTLVCRTAIAADKPPIYLWFEPEWFEGVKGSFNYWTGTFKATGSWGIAGPGISPEWTQGGESEWNSMGAAAEETKAACHREFIVPRAGHYKVWVRYVDHRNKTEPFRVSIEQGGKPAIVGEMGVKPVVSPGDEYALYWGFSFGWDHVAGDLAAGPARLTLSIDKPGEAWRQVDAVLITDDPKYVPVGREKPKFSYLSAIDVRPDSTTAWRGSAQGLVAGPPAPRLPLAGLEFSMWTGIEALSADWLKKQNLATLSLYDIFFEVSPPSDIRDKFHAQFAGRKDLPIMSWPLLRPGLYLATPPDLSPEQPLRQWLERTKTPFYMMTNYANPTYTDKTGPATYQALTGPLANQFMGYIHGEAVGTLGVSYPREQLGKTRREHVDAIPKVLLAQQAKAWSTIYKTPVPESHWAKGISCLSVDSIALAHLFHEMGSNVVGYELDATNLHVPMRIAFERGAARQYGGGWLSYTSGNFGDACDYFSQQPVVPRGAPSWFHSKYAVTDGVSISWYRKLYYLNYLGGASAIYWEQSLANQWMMPGPGTHPIELSPFGRATEDFQAFVSRLPDRGEPYTPVALLLSYGHGYERVNNACKMLEVFTEDKSDLELRELFNVCWYPSGVVEGMPATPDSSMPNGVYGNIFDVLVDRPARAKSMFNYPVVWAAGDVELTGPMQATVEDYVRRGGTLVVNIEAAKKLPATLLGVRPTGKTTIAEEWSPDGQDPRAATPFEVAGVESAGAKVLAWATAGVPLVTSQQVGQGRVILTLVPRMMGLDERAHPALPFVMNGVTADLLPVDVRMADGSRPRGEVLYQVNKTKNGYLVLLMNNRGVDKTQNGVARVDRRKFADVVVSTKLPVRSVKEYTTPKDLRPTDVKGASTVHVRLYPADIQVIGIATQ